MRQLIERHRWLMLVAATLCECVVFFPNGWSVLQPYLSDQLGYTAEAASMALPVAMVVFAAASILSGMLQSRLSPRAEGLIGVAFLALGFVAVRFVPAGKPIFFYLGFSVPCGAGCGFFYMTTLTLKLRWFADRRGLAAGTTSAIAAAFLIAQTYLTDALFSRVDVRNAFLIVGAVGIAASLVSCIFLEAPTAEYVEARMSKAAQAGGKNLPGPDLTPGEMVRTPQFYLYAGALIFSVPAFMLLNPRLVSLCMGKGLSKELALSTVAVGSATSALGRLVIPILSDKTGRKGLMGTMWALLGVTTFLFLVGRGPALILIWGALALCYNGGATLISSFTSDLFGLAHVGTNAAIMNIPSAIGSLIGYALVPLLTPLLGDGAIYIVSIAGAAIAAVCIFAIRPVGRKD